ncbi:MAG: FecR domain-containing protein [Myxococcales bacterium]|nr:FecR domain-containing protein [Myxococcales bacterium]
MRDDRDDLVPPVEPLPDLTWARLERRLWQSLDAPATAEAAEVAPPRAARWRWPVVAATAIAAAAAVAILWPRGEDHAAQPAPLSMPTGTATPARVTSADAPTALTFGDADIQLAPRSALFLSGDDRRGVDLVLDHGRAHFEVAPRAGRAPFVVHVGAVRVTVIGTGFTVIRDGESAQVEVTHGIVEVVADGQRDRVAAGQVWDHGLLRDGTLAAAPTAPATFAPAIDAAPAPAIAADAPPTVASAPPRTPAPPPAARVERRAPTAPAAPTVAPPLDPKAAFAAAAALEAQAPDRALAAYLALADAAPAWADAALFAAARLAFDRGDHARARSLAERYLRRFPHGRNALDARALLERL